MGEDIQGGRGYTGDNWERLCGRGDPLWVDRWAEAAARRRFVLTTAYAQKIEVQLVGQELCSCHGAGRGRPYGSGRLGASGSSEGGRPLGQGLCRLSDDDNPAEFP